MLGYLGSVEVVFWPHLLRLAVPPVCNPSLLDPTEALAPYLMNQRESNSSNSLTERFQILSLDGGGAKGIFAAAVLAAIEEDLKIVVVDHFDLIAGTSTGGIIAIALGLGLRPREIVEFYLRECPRIFPRYLGLKSLQHWLWRKFSSKPLEEALKHCLREQRFGDSRKRLIIPSYNLGEDDVYIFRTPHHERLRRDFKVPAWKVAKATSAAPTFFPCARDVDNLRLIDGGVWANNPAVVAIAEAVETLKVPPSALHLFSIGTSDAVARREKRLNSGGIVAWGMDNAAIDVIMRGQSIGANNQAKLLLGKDHVERLDPKVAVGEFPFDRACKADDLIAKARHHSRILTPAFEERYARHVAPAYTPIY
jgi:uncharacterized protein